MKLKNLNMQPTALLAEFVGTFVLAIVALAIGQPLIVGFVLVVLVLVLGRISGAHLNPAVTFGLWSVRKLDAIKIPFYWAMQFAGAFAALLIIQVFKGGDFGISFSSFASFDAKLVIAEIIGAAIFTFAIAAAVEHKLDDTAKAFAIGLALMGGLYAGGGLLAIAAQAVSTNIQETPRAAKVDGVLLNPAISLAATERTEDSSSLLGSTGSEETKPTTPVSRLTLETIVGALLGGAIGANLFMVTAGVNPFAKKETITTKVTKVVKKVKGKK